MAISDQIGRLTTLRNNIRSKLINLGILPAASTSATLSECYNVLSSVTGLSAMSYTPTTTAQTIASGQYLNGVQTINAIPSAYIVPTGTSTVTSNSVYDIRQYASVSVNVQPALQSKTVTPTQAVQSVTPDTGIYGLSKVTVNAIPSAYIIPSGTIVLSSSGTFDVGSYASADVTVTGGPNEMYLRLYGDSYFLENTPSTIPSHTYNMSARTLVASELHNVNSIGSVAFSGAGDIIIQSGTVLWKNMDIIGHQFDEVRNVALSDMNYAEIRFQMLESVPQRAFCMAGITLCKDSFPVCKHIDDYAFAAIPGVNGAWADMYASSNRSYPRYLFDGSKRELNLPECLEIGRYAFAEGYFVYSGCKKTNVSAPKLQSINDGAFFHNVSLESFYGHSVSYLGSNAFAGCISLSIVSFPVLTSLRGGVFAPVGTTGGSISYSKRCSALTEVSMPNLVAINGSDNFRSCTALSNLSFPMLEVVMGFYNWYGCTELTTVDLPNLITISGGYNWQSCTALTTVDLPNLITISGGYNWQYCSNSLLTSINFPKLTTINGPYNFADCRYLKHISVPELITISGVGNFSSCWNLSMVDFPKYSYTSFTASMFMDCYSLYLASFPATSRLSGTYMFRRCYNLISMFLLGSSVCQLGNTIASMFGSTPVSTYSTSAGRYASIFVPRSLVTSYKTATNWTTISSKIVAYEDYFDSNGNPL